MGRKRWFRKQTQMGFCSRAPHADSRAWGGHLEQRISFFKGVARDGEKTVTLPQPGSGASAKLEMWLVPSCPMTLGLWTPGASCSLWGGVLGRSYGGGGSKEMGYLWLCVDGCRGTLGSESGPRLAISIHARSMPHVAHLWALWLPNPHFCLRSD